MRYFVLNFNTTDYLKYKVLNFKTLDKFPYIVEVAFNNIHVDGEFVTGETSNGLMKLPDGARVSEGALKFHGIDGRSGNTKRGIAFTELVKYLLDSDCVVGHNIEFTLLVLEAELMRFGIPMPKVRTFCTMKDTTEFVGIPSQFKPGEFKFPTLQELHLKLFDEAIDKPVAAADSVKVTSKCFLELQKRGLVG